MNEPVVIHWFRRDLRLDDNLALQAALKTGLPVLPVFIFDPAILRSPRTSALRLKFMLDALRSLDVSLQKRGGKLVIRAGSPAATLAEIVSCIGARALYYNRDYSPYARRRDALVQQQLGIPTLGFDDALLAAPGDVMKPDGQPYTVYTPFMKAWKLLPKSQPISTKTGRFAGADMCPSDALPTLRDLAGVDDLLLGLEAREEAAQRRLRQFMDGPVFTYGETRNGLAPEPFNETSTMLTSVLSPYLRFGLLSPRQAYQAARAAYTNAPDVQARQSVESWVNEIVWREFYMHILYHFPYVDRGNFRREYDALTWRDVPNELEAWKCGQTGYPLVDAAMRQLKELGWLPNRARMVVASFLAKDLLVDWRAGELHFMQHLIDGDPAANNGGWQWTAGTGTDAQPYFRVFNPISQSRKFDPEGAYVRRWVPELRDVPDSCIHTPWEMPIPPRGYPPRLVDHNASRERALAAFGAIKRE